MNKIFRRRVQLVILGFTVLWFLAGCAKIDKIIKRPAPSEPKPEPPRAAAFYVHKVKWSGESLSIIAKWYTGNIENWKAVAEANPEINPNRIYLGQELRIPEDLLKTREPMPQGFVESFYSGTEKAPPPPKPQPEKPSKKGEPKLFGPKPYPKE